MVTFEVTPATMTLPAGTYLFSLKSVEPDTEPSKYSDKPRNKWTFVVEDVIDLDDDTDVDTEDLVGREIFQWKNQSMAPNSTQYAWLCGMLGKKSIEKGEKVDSNSLVGKTYRVIWGDKPYQIQSTGESGVSTTIIKITPNKTAKPKATRPAVEPDEDEDF